MSDFPQDVFAISPDIRYVAAADGQQVQMRSRPDLFNASSSASDRYEELLVNPTLLTLATQRGSARACHWSADHALRSASAWPRPINDSRRARHRRARA